MAVSPAPTETYEKQWLAEAMEHIRLRAANPNLAYLKVWVQRQPGDLTLVAVARVHVERTSDGTSVEVPHSVLSDMHEMTIAPGEYRIRTSRDGQVGPTVTVRIADKEVRQVSFDDGVPK